MHTQTPIARLDHPLKGIGFAVMTVFVLALQDALVKWLAADFTLC